MSLASFLDAFGLGVRNFWRPKVTEPLPWKQTRPRAERYRASFALVHDEHGEEACIGCKMCEKICPSQIINVATGPKVKSEATGKMRGSCADFTLDLNACIVCELCVQVCPTDAIVMIREQEKPGFDRNELLLTMEKLYANEKRGIRSWSDGTVLVGMQEPGGGGGGAG